MENSTTEIFSGFNMRYPEFEVFTPQRKQTFTVRSMTVSDEEILKGSVLTPITVSEHLAQVLWNCIVKKPDYIKTYDDFINQVTLRDRDTLVYGLFVATYKDTQSFSYTCSECGRVNKVKINMEKGFQFQLWDKDYDAFTYKKEIPLKILEGVKCYIKAPTIADEIKITSEAAKLPEDQATMMNNLIMIDRFEIPNDQKSNPPQQQPAQEKPVENIENIQSDNKEPISQQQEIKEEVKEESVSDFITIRERNNILTGFSQLPAYDRKLIMQEYEDTFDKYSTGVKAKNKCLCGQERELRVDVTRQFFLALY